MLIVWSDVIYTLVHSSFDRLFHREVSQTNNHEPNASIIGCLLAFFVAEIVSVNF